MQGGGAGTERTGKRGGRSKRSSSSRENCACAWSRKVSGRSPGVRQAEKQRCRDAETWKHGRLISLRCREIVDTGRSQPSRWRRRRSSPRLSRAQRAHSSRFRRALELLQSRNMRHISWALRFIMTVTHSCSPRSRSAKSAIAPAKAGNSSCWTRRRWKTEPHPEREGSHDLGSKTSCLFMAKTADITRATTKRRKTPETAKRKAVLLLAPPKTLRSKGKRHDEEFTGSIRLISRKGRTNGGTEHGERPGRPASPRAV